MRKLIVLGCAALLAVGLSFSAFAGSIVDADSDGVPDSLDNCSGVANGPLANAGACSSQFDVDQDGYGNQCDADISNNGLVGLEDLGPVLSTFNTNNPSTDLSCNGLVGLEDLGRVLSAFGSSPGPSGLGCAGTVPCTN